MDKFTQYVRLPATTDDINLVEVDEGTIRQEVAPRGLCNTQYWEQAELASLGYSFYVHVEPPEFNSTFQTLSVDVITDDQGTRYQYEVNWLPLADIKARATQRINDERAAMLNSGDIIVTDSNGVNWQCNKFSRELIQEALLDELVSPGTLPDQWRAADDSMHACDLNLLKGIMAAYRTFKEDLVYGSWRAKAYIESAACDTPEKAAAVKLSDYM